MKQGHGQTNQLCNINWGELDHASRAPHPRIKSQLIRKLFFTTLSTSDSLGSWSQFFDVGNDQRIVDELRGPALQAQTKPIVISLQRHHHSLRVGHKVTSTSG